jgi:glutathione synthase/RimK-type ligase-like ATP-grasp enzyme
MSRFYIYPYKRGSVGARSLATSLEGRLIRLQGSSFSKAPTRHVVNWGACHCPPGYHPLNPSQLTRVTRDKLQTFKTLSSPVEGLTLPRIPPWTESRQEASQWLSDGDVVVRHSLTGQGGSGIQIVDKGQTELPVAQLYTKYIKKDSEYRVHVFKSSLQGPYEVIHVQRKIRNPTKEPTDWRVRSHNNGFIFARNNAQGQPYIEACPEDVRQQAILAVARSGLDFAGVDVLWNSHLSQAFIIELNSAPGLEGATVNYYRDAVLKYYS